MQFAYFFHVAATSFAAPTLLSRMQIIHWKRNIWQYNPHLSRGICCKIHNLQFTSGAFFLKKTLLVVFWRFSPLSRSGDSNFWSSLLATWMELSDRGGENLEIRKRRPNCEADVFLSACWKSDPDLGDVWRNVEHLDDVYLLQTVFVHASCLISDWHDGKKKTKQSGRP